MSTEIVEPGENLLEDVAAEAQGQEESLQGDIPTELDKKEDPLEADWKISKPLIMEKLLNMGYKQEELPSEEGMVAIKDAHHFFRKRQAERYLKDDETLKQEQDEYNEYYRKHYANVKEESVADALRIIRDWTG